MIYIYIYREYYSSLYSRYDLSRRIIRQIYRYEQFCISRETGEKETREIDNPSEDGVGNGGRIQRRVLVNDCRHSERCKFFAVACHATYLWSPEERRIVGVTVPMFRGIFFDKDWRLATANHIEIKSVSNLFRDSNIANHLSNWKFDNTV